MKKKISLTKKEKVADRWQNCFLVKFSKFLRTPFFTKHLRSLFLEVLCKKCVLSNFAKSPGLCRNLFLTKLFSCKFCKVVESTFLHNTSGRPLLFIFTKFTCQAVPRKLKSFRQFLHGSRRDYRSDEMYLTYLQLFFLVNLQFKFQCWTIHSFLNQQQCCSQTLMKTYMLRVFYDELFQKQPLQVFYKKAVFKAYNFIKQRLQHRCFSVNVAKILRTLILKNICQRLLLLKLLKTSQENIKLSLSF